MSELETLKQGPVPTKGGVESSFLGNALEETPDLLDRVSQTYRLPVMELVEKAHGVHGEHFATDKVQMSRLLSIKTGGCPEDCSYCPQSAHYNTGLKKEKLMELDDVVAEAKVAQAEGATRFCMGAAWREVVDGPQFDRVLEMVRHVNSLGMEVCCTLGMLNKSQAEKLKEAGLYAYNHNIDCSENFYEKIISTRQFQDRLETLDNVRKSGITVCTGGIIGLGESHIDRIQFLYQLTKMSPQPESVTVNTLVAIPGTPLEKQEPVDALEVVRVIATARIHMPHSMIRLSAGRVNMTPAEQLLCFYVGANSVFLGEKLLTSSNPEIEKDQKLFEDLNLRPMECSSPSVTTCLS